MKCVLVTGGTGLIGSRLVSSLLREGVEVRALVRPTSAGISASDADRATLIVADLTDRATLSGVCDSVDTVFHLAGFARADNGAGADDAHWSVTVDGTRALLEEAVRAQVRRFVFTSTVKAMGEGGLPCRDEQSPASAVCGYGRAKLEAERLVLKTAQDAGMGACVLRLPPVYGPQGKGNILRMIAAIDRGLFPPLPDTHNSRSMVHVDDVVRALQLAATRPEASGGLYIVTDGKMYSGRALYVSICRALGRDVPRWRMPVWALRLGAGIGDAVETFTGRSMPLNSSVLDKLIGSACYRSDKIRRELGFVPRYTLDDALPGMVAAYRSARSQAPNR